MSYSFAEKLQYNQAREKESRFAAGYVLGVNLYHAYTPALKNDIRGIIDAFKATVKATPCDCEHEKGILCGYRDAANERKRTRRLTPKEIFNYDP